MSTQDSNIESVGVLRSLDLSERFALLAPEEWKALPKASEGFKSKELKLAEFSGKAQMFSQSCESAVPTDEEIKSLISGIQSAGKPVGWIAQLVGVTIPTWTEGKDPTVKDFLEGNMNQEDIKPKHVILSYPIMESN